MKIRHSHAGLHNGIWEELNNQSETPCKPSNYHSSEDSINDDFNVYLLNKSVQRHITAIRDPKKRKHNTVQLVFKNNIRPVIMRNKFVQYIFLNHLNMNRQNILGFHMKPK